MGYPKTQYTFSAFLTFSGGNNHARIGNGNTDAGNDFCKGIIINAVIEGGGVNIVGMADSGYADGMRAYAEYAFQMLCVHQKPCKFIAIQLQAEQNANPDIINAALHGSVHRFGVVGIIMLRACGMQVLIAFLVVGFLKEDICPDAGILQLTVIFHRCCRNIDIHAANRAVFMLDAVNRLNAFQYIFDGVIDGVLACFQCQTLMPHILQSCYLSDDFLLCQLFSADVLIFRMVRTVYTAVDAVIGEIQRRKHYNAVAVKILFNLLCQRVNFFVFFGNIAVQKHHCLSVRKSLSEPCLFDNAVN